ncbi:unnamed protein product [Brachionus calyciflorus]|uniref:Uncharacterized protein n=1 Tax=Brachionus calyciflorus TaxID=104777 RepID=A0A814GWI7_9BILA|nr:unnamed protein product [Brachionus calyciflorus]
MFTKLLEERKKAIIKFYIDEIESHLVNLSSIATNRFLKKEQTNAYYMSTSIEKAFQSFKYKEDISYSSFFKYTDDRFKKPHRISDLCDYCEKKKDLIRNLLRLSQESGYEGIEDFSSIKEYLILNKSRQREAYNSMRQNLEDDYILIDMDWKQKVMIGLSPRQPSNEYRNQISRTVFGFGIYYKKNGIVEFLNINLISCHPSSETGLEKIVQTFAFVVDSITQESRINEPFQKIKGITSYYNFFNNNSNEIRSVVISDLRQSKLVEFEDSNNLNNYPTIEKKVIVQKLPNIIRKTKNIKKNLRSIQISLNSDINSSQELSDIMANKDNSLKENENTSCNEECKNCKNSPRFRISDLQNQRKNILKEELLRHSHQSLENQINGKVKNKEEVLDELKNHYLRNHINQREDVLESNFRCLTRIFGTLNSLLMHKLRLKH